MDESEKLVRAFEEHAEISKKLPEDFLAMQETVLELADKVDDLIKELKE